MAVRIFVTNFKLALRNKTAVFWTMIFGILLGTLFYAAFKDIYSSQTIDTIETALVISDMNGYEFEGLADMLDTMEQDDGTPLLHATEMSEDAAKTALSEGEVSGIIYVTLDQKKLAENAELPPISLTLTVRENGLSESILTMLVGELQAKMDYLTELYAYNPVHYRAYLRQMSASIDDVLESSVVREAMSGENKDPMVTYFYNLIAMVCLFCSLASLQSTVRTAANIEEVGKRIELAPYSKVIYELTSVAAVYVLQLIATSVVLCYLIFVLGIRFGGSYGYLFLITALGTLLGVSLGYMVAHIGSSGYEKKESLLTVITLVGGFLAGLMVHNMKAVVEEHAPIINRINPSAVITDAFYSLNTYGPGERLTRAVTYMVVLSVAFLTAGSLMGRRRSYDSL